MATSKNAVSRDQQQTTDQPSNCLLVRVILLLLGPEFSILVSHRR